ncbi:MULTISPECIES: hypothetical protein [unclassified Microbacterium]|uniref:hypothetical protein n=1 Tax=unclassified Microbacterium TaxID=2609290 RepID=UPI00301ACE0E
MRTAVTSTTAEIVTFHLMALAPAAIGLCCLAADRRRARIGELAASVLMMLAMVDAAVGRVVPVVWWVVVLLAGAMALAAAHGRPRSGPRAGSAGAGGTTMAVHAAGGMIVMAVLLLAMAGGIVSGADAGAGGGHVHGGAGGGGAGMGVAAFGAILAGVYVVASLIVIARARSRLDRGQYAAMAASAGLMAWSLVA